MHPKHNISLVTCAIALYYTWLFTPTNEIVTNQKQIANCIGYIGYHAQSILNNPLHSAVPIISIEMRHFNICGECVSHFFFLFHFIRYNVSNTNRNNIINMETK